MKISVTFIILLFLLMAVPWPTHAYLDLGSASYIFQMIIASALAGVFVLKTFWTRMITRLIPLFPRRGKDNEENDQQIHGQWSGSRLFSIKPFAAVVKFARHSIEKKIGTHPAVPPFLFALFPVFFLAANNSYEVAFVDIFLVIAVVLVLAEFLFTFFWLVFRDMRKASVAACLTLLLLFSYGHVADSIGGVWFRQRYLLGLWAMLLPLGIFAVARTHRSLDNLIKALQITAGILVSFSFISFGGSVFLHYFQDQQAFVAQSERDGELQEVLGTNTEDSSPDIYFILVDGYPSQWELKEYFDYDNREFIDHLSSGGFYVVPRSRSNYWNTHFSVPTLLNMDYVENLSPTGKTSYSHQIRLMNDHAVGRFLKSKGYTYIHLGARANWEQGIKSADLNIQRKSPSEFFQLLYDSTVLYPLSTKFGLFGVLNEFLSTRYLVWEWNRYQFDELTKIPPLPSPKFVFTHLLIPHDLVFKADGTFLDLDEVRANAEDDSLENYRRNYRQQMMFVNNKLETLVDEILRASEIPPIIIIQSDHGTSNKMEEAETLDQVSDASIRRGLRNFSAFYLPSGGQELLYETITPVNTFRVIFNSYFQADYEFLPDESYISVPSNHYKFMNVTDRAKYDI